MGGGGSAVARKKNPQKLRRQNYFFLLLLRIWHDTTNGWATVLDSSEHVNNNTFSK